MTISVDWANRVIESTASITDLPAFHATLRDLEGDPVGVIFPVTHTWKALDLSGGAFFYQADMINGYRLKFVGAGPFVIQGNLNGTVVDTGVQVERKTSSAFSTTAVGDSGPSAVDIAGAVLGHLSADLDRLAEVWARLGLDPGRPLVQDETRIGFGTVALAVEEAAGTVTVTRQ